MADKTIPSSIFRVSYATLDEPVAVTVLGRVIGRWTPVGSPVISPPVGSVVRTPEPAPEPLTGNGSVAGTTEFKPYSKAAQAKGKR